jgi:ATP-dependent Clp protease protease subunit
MTDLRATLRLDDDDDDDGEEERPEPKEKPPEAPPPSPVAQQLYESRTILLFGEISQKVSREVIAQLLAMSAKSEDAIRMIICSQGGHVEAGDTIHDMIRFIRPRVIMIGTGWVASAGAHIYLGAERKNRVCLPNTRFLLHQPMGGVGGPAADIDIEAREIIKMRRRINSIIAQETGQALEKVERDTDRNFWMSASEAKDYGIVSRIVETMDEIE